MAYRWPRWGRSPTLALLTVAVLVTPLAGQQWLPPRPKVVRAARPPAALPTPLRRFARQIRAAAAPLSIPVARLGPARVTVAEAEPNDSVTTATPAALGDTVTGVIDPAGDVDYYALDLVAGTTMDIDVDAQVLGSALDSYIALISADQGVLALSDDHDGLDSRILYVIPATGRYYVGITDYRYPTAGGSGYTYRIALRTVATDETEPNNTAATADPMTTTDTLIAAVGTSDDVDYYALDVAAGTHLGAMAFAVENGPPLHLAVVGTDGVTLLAADSEGLGVRRYLPNAGRYYVAVRSLFGLTGLYQVSAAVLPTGPGDPVTALYADIQGVTTAAAGLAGDVFAYQGLYNNLLHISSGGAVTTIGHNLFTFVVDGFGDVLAPNYDANTGTQSIQRIGAAGEQSVFAADAPYLTNLATSPDGDVWGYGCRQTCGLWHYDPLGQVKDSVAVSLYASQMAFSPGGVLHFVNWSDTVYRVSQGRVTAALVEPGSYFGALAFDRDGYLYASAGVTGTINLYTSSYQPASAPFAATNMSGPVSLFFLRDGSGAMTARLLATNGTWNVAPDFGGRIVEVNPTGVRAAGHPVQPLLLRVDRGALHAATVGGAYADTLRAADVAGHDVSGSATWRVTNGALPPGLALEAATGILSGVPSDSGTFTFSVLATAAGQFGPGTFTVDVGVPGISVVNAINGLLGVTGTLTAEEQRYLDLAGNSNGHLDIGDVRAFLLAHGQLAGSTAAPMPDRREEP